MRKGLFIIGSSIRKSLALLLTVTLLLLLYNNTVNRHFHMLPGGLLIEHAHPFGSPASIFDGIDDHSHSDKEILLLG